MKVVIHDLDARWGDMIGSGCDVAVAADGQYAPFRGWLSRKAWERG